MSEQTINFTIPHQQQSLFEEEVKRSGFGTSAEFLRELVLDYLEMRRVESLVIEGLNDPNVERYDKQELEDIKQEILENGKATLRTPTN